MDKTERLRAFIEDAFAQIAPHYQKDLAFVVFKETGEIPLLENFLYALLLCKKKTVESLFSGMDHFNKLFPFRGKEALFPKSLHHFPKEGDFYTNLKIGLILLETIHSFLKILPEEAKTVFLEETLLFFKALKRKEKEFLGISKDFYLLLFQWGKILSIDFSCLEPVFKEAQPLLSLSLYEDKEMEAWLALLYSKGDFPLKNGYLTSFLDKVAPCFSAYKGLRKKITHRGYEEAGSLFSYFTAFHQGYPLSKGKEDPLNCLEVALFSPEDSLGTLFFEKKEKEDYNITFFKRGERKREDPNNPFFIPWYGVFPLEQEKNKVVSFGVHLLKPLTFEIEEINSTSWKFHAKIEEESAPKAMEDEVPVAFYLPYLPCVDWKVNGIKKSTFQSGEKIELFFPTFSLELVFKGGKGFGQISFQNRPSRMFFKEENRFFPFDISVGYREIDPSFKRELELEITLKKGNKGA